MGLGAEVILSYFIFSSYAFYMTGEGNNYASPQVYSGPAGTLARVFYFLLGLTVTCVILPPVIAAGTWLYRAQFKPKGEKAPSSPTKP
jgi:hypothetical protein